MAGADNAGQLRDNLMVTGGWCQDHVPLLVAEKTHVSKHSREFRDESEKVEKSAYKLAFGFFPAKAYGTLHTLFFVAATLRLRLKES